MKDVYVCVPVLKRYDLLALLLRSLEQSTVRPAAVHIIDNGRDCARLKLATSNTDLKLEITVPDAPMGLAEAWNQFLIDTPEERVLCNDDVTFAPDSLKQMMETPGEFVSALAGSNACSCFLLRDSCIEQVGFFDEMISPGYAYFEDCDYVERMVQKKIRITGVDCGVVHIGSQTIARNSAEEMNNHHRRFLLAQHNFVVKWGRMPDLNREGLYD